MKYLLSKVTFLVLFAFLLTQSLHAGWFDRDEYKHSTTDRSLINEQLQYAKEQNKYIIIEASHQRCPYCDRMNNDVFSDDDVREVLKEHFVFIKIDITHGNTALPDGVKNLFKGGTPTFFILDSTSTVEDTIVGSMSKDEFLGLLEMYM
jgi:thioredoxin-related protein